MIRSGKSLKGSEQRSEISDLHFSRITLVVIFKRKIREKARR